MKNDISATQNGTDIEAAEALTSISVEGAKENILNQLRKRIIGQGRRN